MAQAPAAIFKIHKNPTTGTEQDRQAPGRGVGGQDEEGLRQKPEPGLRKR
jgi:hypothetical protein